MPFLVSLFAPFRKKRELLIQSYAQTLDNYFPYYKKLKPEARKVFIERILHFRKSKSFHFLEMEKSADIEVLVSAAAVQLTFGLPEYNYGFFEDIYIIKGAYTYGANTTPWAGHVNHQGIHVAWDHVLKGYVSETDGYNVGLHEMAHAFEYELVFGDYAFDHILKSRFYAVSIAIKDTVIDQPYHPAELYSPQGLSNNHESWAESVELFFEKPAKLKEYYPGLFSAIAQLLQQDPLQGKMEEQAAATSSTLLSTP